MHHDMLFHPVHPGARHGYLAVVNTGDHAAVYPVDGAVTGNDSEFKTDLPQSIGRGLAAGAEFISRGSIDQLKKLPAAEPVNNLTPLVRRSEHDHPSKPRLTMPGKIASYQDAPE